VGLGTKEGYFEYFGRDGLVICCNEGGWEGEIDGFLDNEEVGRGEGIKECCLVGLKNATEDGSRDGANDGMEDDNGGKL